MPKYGCLLKYYAPYQKKLFPCRLALLNKSVNHILEIVQSVPALTDKRQIEIQEANAAKWYWRAIRLIARREDA